MGVVAAEGADIGITRGTLEVGKALARVEWRATARCSGSAVVVLDRALEGSFPDPNKRRTMKVMAGC